VLPFLHCNAPPGGPRGRPAGSARTLPSMHGMGSAVVLVIAFAAIAAAAAFVAAALYRATCRGRPDAPGEPGRLP